MLKEPMPDQITEIHCRIGTNKNNFEQLVCSTKLQQVVLDYLIK